jgi:hypothetical protein
MIDYQVAHYTTEGVVRWIHFSASTF